MAALLGAGVALTFLREALLAYLYGASAELDRFRIAYALPNLMSQGFASAYLGASIPLLIGAEARSNAAGLAVRRQIVRFGVVLAVVITIAGVATAGFQARLFAPGMAVHDDRLVVDMRLCWLMFTVIGATFGMRAVLNSERRFLSGAAAPALRSVVFCVALIGAALLSLQHDVNVLSLSAIASGLAVLVFHGVSMVDMRDAKESSADTAKEDTVNGGAIHGEGLVARLSVAVALLFAYQAFMSAPRFVDRAFGSVLDVGAISLIEYAYALVTAIGVAVISGHNIIGLPRYSRQRLRGSGMRILDRDDLWIVSISALLGGVLLLFPEAVVRLCYARGEFTEQHVLGVAAVLRWQGGAMAFMALGLIGAQRLMANSMHHALIGAAVVKLSIKYIVLDAAIVNYGLEAVGMSYLAAEAIFAFLVIGLLLVVRRVPAHAN